MCDVFVCAHDHYPVILQTEELKKQMQELQEKYTDLIATCERIKTRISQTS